MPGGRGNIDHIAVAPSGVYVIDAKDVAGKVVVRTPLFGTTRMRGHLLLYRKALTKRLNAAGPLDAKRIDAVACQLAGAMLAA